MVNMIKVKTKKDGSNYRMITVIGHAMYDDYGKDIVCSAASSIVTTTINGIIALNKDNLSYMVSKKGISITINSNDRTTQVLIRNMINLLKELSGNYPENIEID